MKIEEMSLVSSSTAQSLVFGSFEKVCLAVISHHLRMQEQSNQANGNLVACLTCVLVTSHGLMLSPFILHNLMP